MRIVCLSDTHTFGKRITVPDGDVLVHAGDHTFRGTESEIKAAFKWLNELPHIHKLVIAGNHDWFFDPNAPPRYRSWSLHKHYTTKGMMAKFPTVTYLQDEEVVIDGVKFYGSPWQPNYYDWAFNFKPVFWHDQARSTWGKIPDDTNVLITHSPPAGILDQTLPGDERTGCYELRSRVNSLTKLRLHVFGHLHEAYGREDYEDEGDGQKLTFVNAAINTRDYEPTNLPIVVDI